VQRDVLAVDLVFYGLLPSLRGEWPYWTAELAFQILIALSLYKGWIIIYSGASFP